MTLRTTTLSGVLVVVGLISALALTVTGVRAENDDVLAQGAITKRAATTPDLNGDGFADLAIGIPWLDRRYKDEGAVYVVQGSERGLSPARHRVWTSAGSGLSRRERRGARFGWSLSSERAASGTPRTAPPRT